MCLTALKAPVSWYDDTKSAHPVLKLMSPLYAAGHNIHQSLAKPYTAKIPVVCIGNLVVGGSGKTPTAIAVLQALQGQSERKICFLSRGYGGKTKGPVLVDVEKHTAENVGDEPLLLARHAPVIVSANRKAGAQFAEDIGFELIIMDDGFQNPQLVQTVSIVVIDGATGFGNKQTLPAGPLREPLEAGFERADAFILIGEDQHGAGKLLPSSKPLVQASIQACSTWQRREDVSYVGFSGIAHPDKFKKTLEKNGVTPVEFFDFPDHHHFSDEEIEMLKKALIAHKDSRLITTEKDFVRIKPTLRDTLPLDILPIQVQFDPSAILDLIDTRNV